MLSFFFNRSSRMVLAMECVGLPLMAIALARIFVDGSATARALVAAVFFLYAFMRFCASRRWYKDAPRYSGVELQFKKAMVPTSYTMAVAGLLCLPWPSAAVLAPAAFLLAVIAHVNVILLYLRSKDKDSTPVNFFTSGAFLLHDAKPPRQKSV